MLLPTLWDPTQDDTWSRLISLPPSWPTAGRCHQHYLPLPFCRKQHTGPGALDSLCQDLLTACAELYILCGFRYGSSSTLACAAEPGRAMGRRGIKSLSPTPLVYRALLLREQTTRPPGVWIKQPNLSLPSSQGVSCWTYSSLPSPVISEGYHTWPQLSQSPILLLLLVWLSLSWREWLVEAGCRCPGPIPSSLPLRHCQVLGSAASWGR